MKLRYRMPTIFSIYMVDVLCCALGCVILLWLINFREAKNRATAASETGKRLTDTKSDLDLAKRREQDLQDRLKILLADQAKNKLALNASQDLLKIIQSERDKALALVLVSKKDQAAVKLALDLSEKELAKLRLSLKDLQGKSASELAKKNAELAKLLKMIAALELRSENLEKSRALTEKELAKLRMNFKDLQVKSAADLAASKAELDKLLKKITLAELRSKTLEKDLADKGGLLLLADAASVKLAKELAAEQLKSKDYKSKLTVAELRARLLEDDLAKSKKDVLDYQKRFRDLFLSQEALSKRMAQQTKDLSAANNTISLLKEEKSKLANQVQLVKEEGKHRFAGITLTGQSVLFLVDMSGSMAMTDENTLDPDKWPEVCATIGKIMRSMPNLKKYQVILFSDKVRYPLGRNRRWLDFELGSTPRTVVNALKEIKPKGETNMADVFEEAFRYRADGLDTIYLISDGLPNAGDGLPANSSNLTESQKTEYCSKYIRNRLKTVLNRAKADQAKVRINTIGFFFESPDVGAFLWALAREHDGSFVGMSK